MKYVQVFIFTSSILSGLYISCDYVMVEICTASLPAFKRILEAEAISMLIIL